MRKILYALSTLLRPSSMPDNSGDADHVPKIQIPCEAARLGIRSRLRYATRSFCAFREIRRGDGSCEGSGNSASAVPLAMAVMDTLTRAPQADGASVSLGLSPMAALALGAAYSVPESASVVLCSADKMGEGALLVGEGSSYGSSSVTLLSEESVNDGLLEGVAVSEATADDAAPPGRIDEAPAWEPTGGILFWIGNFNSRV